MENSPIGSPTQRHRTHSPIGSPNKRRYQSTNGEDDSCGQQSLTDYAGSTNTCLGAGCTVEGDACSIVVSAP